MNIVVADGPLLDQILGLTFEIWNEGLTDVPTRSGMPRNCGRRGGASTFNDLPWSMTPASCWRRRSATAIACVSTAGLDGWPALARCSRHRCSEARDTRRSSSSGLLEIERSEGALLAGLFSEIGPAFYERLGFTPIPIDEVTVRVEAARRCASDTRARRRRTRSACDRSDASGPVGGRPIRAQPRPVDDPLRAVEEAIARGSRSERVFGRSSSLWPRKARPRLPTPCSTRTPTAGRSRRPATAIRRRAPRRDAAGARRARTVSADAADSCVVAGGVSGPASDVADGQSPLHATSSWSGRSPTCRCQRRPRTSSTGTVTTFKCGQC